MDPRLLRTQFAAKAATLADQFGAALASYTVSGHRVEMTAPEGSTGGGVQALQHIRLVPQHPGGRALIVGNANRTTASAELRSLAYLDEVSLERFGERTGLDPQQYASFVAAASSFLDKFGLAVTQVMQAPPARPAPPSHKLKAGFSPVMVAVIVIWSVAVLAIGLAVGVMATRGKLGH
jgi:hypothetical protein